MTADVNYDNTKLYIIMVISQIVMKTGCSRKHDIQFLLHELQTRELYLKCPSSYGNIIMHKPMSQNWNKIQIEIVQQ